MDLVIDPPGELWPDLVRQAPSGAMFGRSLREWRVVTRQEIGVDAKRLVIATGHQTLLWHPGILAKYFAAQAIADAVGAAMANLIVDQHVAAFATLEYPYRRADGALAVRALELARPRPEVPMAWHRGFTPPPLPESLGDVAPSVESGIRRTFSSVSVHSDAPNAALQMAESLADLMSRWVRPLPNVTATMLIQTTLGQTMMEAMVDDPAKCAECYNRAVAKVPEAGIGPLMIRDDYVELPLWRIGDDGRRKHAYDADVERAAASSPAESNQSTIVNRQSSIALLPRALFMTAVVRLGMCDLFIHGTGGARYDRAMELWIEDWLGVKPGSIAVVSATLRLPLMADQPRINVREAIQKSRRLWHDPDAAMAMNGPSTSKRSLVESIAAAPRDSAERKAAFLSMHDQLAIGRHVSQQQIAAAKRDVETAMRQASDARIAERRDWPFPLYPDSMLDELQREVTAALS